MNQLSIKIHDLPCMNNVVDVITSQHGKIILGSSKMFLESFYF